MARTAFTMAGKIPPSPPGTPSRSSSHWRAASTARRRSGRGEKRSQILRPSSTPMKKFFQKSAASRMAPASAGSAGWPSRGAAGHSSSRAEVAREPGDGLSVQDDEQRHDDRARPVGHLVDVEEEEGPRQQHDLDGHGRDAIPVVLAEQGEQDLGEDVGLDRAAHGADTVARPDHGRIVDRLPRPSSWRSTP